MNGIPSTLREIDAIIRPPAPGAPPAVDPHQLRRATLQAIESITGRPLVCYVARVDNKLNTPFGAPPSFIDHEDVIYINDILFDIGGDELDFLIISNGGVPEAAERIVSLLRPRFKRLRWVVPFNAYSAATLLCLSGDEVVMSATGTLGPVDPQIQGVPAHIFINGFERMLHDILQMGQRALPAYLPLVEEYTLDLIEFCRTAIQLSKELAKQWLGQYMLQRSPDDDEVESIAEFLSNYNIHKTHGRNINRDLARQKGLKVVHDDDIPGLQPLLQSLLAQYHILFESFPFLKVFENTRDRLTTLSAPVPTALPPSSPSPVSAVEEAASAENNQE